MSYILDALRKSDAQRRRGAAPPLLAPQASAAAPARSRLPYYVLAALVLVAAGVVIGALRPWETEPPPAIAVAPVRAPEPAPAPASAPVSAAPPPAAPALAPVKRQAIPAVRSEPKARAAQPPRQAAAAEPKPAAKPAAAPRQEIPPAFGELPVAIQQEIPALTISAHAYSPVAKERLVGINDRVLREGAEVAPGLVLEQITLEGMILSYKGYRFRRGAR